MPRKDHLPRQTRQEHITLQPNRSIEFRVTDDFGSFSPPHWHDALEIIYILEGSSICHALGPHKDRPSGSISADQFRSYPHGALSVHGKPLDSDADSGCVPCELSA